MHPKAAPVSSTYLFIGIFFILLVLIGLYASDGIRFLSALRKNQYVSAHLDRGAEAIDTLRTSVAAPTKTVERAGQQYRAALGKITEAVQSAEDVEGERPSIDYRAILNRLSGDQLMLRAIGLQPPQESVDVINEARYENIELQERVAMNIEETRERTAEIRNEFSCPGCNVVLLSLTTLRKDRIGLYGYEKGTTPNIDSFFDDAIIFTDVLSPSSWTIPDAISLFTGLLPYSHGVAYREPPSLPTLFNTNVKTVAQILSAHEYRTAAFTGGGDYNRRYTGLDRGFDTYLDEVTYQDFGIIESISMGAKVLYYTPLRAYYEQVNTWLEENSQKPFLLFVQGYDTHCPLYPREPFASTFTKGLSSTIDFSFCHWTFGKTDPVLKDGIPRWKTVAVDTKNNKLTPVDVEFTQKDLEYMSALYDARVAEVDHYLGFILQEIERLGLLENTIVILTSDHGDTLGEHGVFMRSAAMRGATTEEVLRIPLLIRHPKVKDVIRVENIAQITDIMPTILSMLTIPDRQERIRDGISLEMSLLNDIPPRDYAVGGALFVPFVRSEYQSRASMADIIRSKDWKLVRETVFEEKGLHIDTVSYELFNLTNDPHELEDMYEREPHVAKELQKELEEWTGKYFPVF